MAVQSVQIIDSGYGKGGVKILYVSKQGSVHFIQELEVETIITLDNHKDYETGNNEDIIATDSQKNTVYALAKLHGIGSPEEFGLLLATHFIAKYPWVVKSVISISAHPWERITDKLGRPHQHAFVSQPMLKRICSVEMVRGQNKPIVSSGIRNLRVLKTTQSAFVNFVRDEYRSLPDAEDRLFSTIVSADWTYNTITKEVNFDQIFNIVRDSVLEVFAGPADTGVFSPSVQNSQHLTQKMVLGKVPQISEITMVMPNVHNFAFDFSKLPKLKNELSRPGLGDVYQPVDKPSGTIKSTMARIGSKL